MNRRFDYTNERWRRLAHEIQGQRGCRCVVCGTLDVRTVCHHTVQAGVYGDDYDYNPQYIEVICWPCHETLHKEIFPHPTIYHYALEIKNRTRTWEEIPEDPEGLRDNVYWLTLYPKAIELTQIWLETPKPWQMPKQQPAPTLPAPLPAMAKATEVWHSRVPYQFGLDLGIAANDDQFRPHRPRRRG